MKSLIYFAHMTLGVLISLCSLLLLAYVFEISYSWTKIPSVILLLILGFLVRQGLTLLELTIPKLDVLLPFFGTVGLILIVLEGALELEFNRSKFKTIRKATVLAFLTLIATSFLLAFAFQFFEGVALKVALTNAIPFCVVSSAIAIPSVRNLASQKKEIIIYDSSMSDILGVLFFNFIVLNDVITSASFGTFLIELILIVVISFLSVVGLAFMLSRIRHHLTFTPIILLVILIYAISKAFHLPGLIFILVFGLFLGNLDEFHSFKWIRKLNLEKLDAEVHKFKKVTIEATFLIRAIFFILFGFLMQAKEIFNLRTLPWAFAVVIVAMGIRFAALKIAGLVVNPLLYIAPRGLITILLYLAIPLEQNIDIVNKSLVIQVIIISVLIMTFGLIKRNHQDHNQHEVNNTI